MEPAWISVNSKPWYPSYHNCLNDFNLNIIHPNNQAPNSLGLELEMGHPLYCNISSQCCLIAPGQGFMVGDNWTKCWKHSNF